MPTGGIRSRPSEEMSTGQHQCIGAWHGRTEENPIYQENSTSSRHHGPRGDQGKKRNQAKNQYTKTRRKAKLQI